MTLGNLPLQQDADETDPRSALAWIGVGLPSANKTAPLIVAPDTLGDWSEHWWAMGVRHHPELQKIHYVPPPADHNWIMGSAGHWGPINEPMPPEVTAPDTSHLTLQEKAILLKRLQDEIGTKTIPQDFAGVIQ